MDILKRLQIDFWREGDPDLKEAADEIERLRQRVELLEGYLNGALNLVENFAHCGTTDARKALEGK
jgi:hypothetical protein